MQSKSEKRRELKSLIGKVGGLEMSHTPTDVFACKTDIVTCDVVTGL